MKFLNRKTIAFLSAILFLSVSANFPAVCAENPGSSEILVNEICTQNDSCLTDSYGAYSDWIEIYNSGDTAVNLEGYALSDDENQPAKFVFPETAMIEPESYLIVFASKQNSTGSEFHTGFALSKNGETLLLSSPDGVIIQKTEIPTLGEDQTFGRIADGTMQIMSPTPHEVNTEVVACPVFSAESGFYKNEFALRLSASDNTEIYYTLDGSNPVTSETAIRYQETIAVTDRSNEPNLYSAYGENQTAQSICVGVGYQPPRDLVDKACIIRAVAKNTKTGSYSPVVQQSYFVTDGELADYQDLTVISLVTDPENLFDPDTGIYVVGTKYHEWRESLGYVSDSGAWDEDKDPETMRNYHIRGKAGEREASITIFENGSTIAQQNMGIRIKGSSTRNSANKSFSLFARSEYGASKLNAPVLPDNDDWQGNLITSYDSITLRSSGSQRTRDSIAHKIIKKENLTTMDMKPCVLFLNGEYWGLYEITEKFSDDFIQSNYGIPKKDVVMIKDWDLEEGTQQDFDEYMDKIYYYATLDMTKPENYQLAFDFMDLDSLIEHYAAGLYLGVTDWPNYNYGVWKSKGAEIAGNPYSDGRWRLMSFDFDHSMGYTYDSEINKTNLYNYNWFEKMDTETAPTNFFVSLLKNKEFRLKFIKVYQSYANDLTTTDRIEQILAEYYDKDQYMNLVGDSEVRWSDAWNYGSSKEQKKQGTQSYFRYSVLDNISNYFKKIDDYSIPYMYAYLGLTEPGDVNADGEFSVADAVMLQKWLLGSGELTNWRAGDLCEDGKITIYDFLRMKQLLIGNNQNA
ncbi:MAG: CotH kinase family protein [Oscillospiraceae bacterium]|nr:CotH kinase family protein [Oscillospiraceae bacterium]